MKWTNLTNIVQMGWNQQLGKATYNQVLPVVTFVGALSDVLRGLLSDLHLGDQKVTWTKLRFFSIMSQL